MSVSGHADRSRAASTSRGGQIWVGATVLAVVYGLTVALSRAWVNDDAFISFRYAENLANGLGLVFNAGERVEGYSNFLWTVWCALGIRLGAYVEYWSIVWGLVLYAASILLLALHQWRWREAAGRAHLALPVGAVLAALHRDWQVYATGGLETSLFTFLVLAGYLLLVDGPHCIAAGIVFSLAALTRPDGVIFAAVAALYVAVVVRPFPRSVIFFSLPCLLVLAPFELWRLSYYGDWVPNTFYAKSADLTWYSQGWTYVRLFFFQYWALLLGLPLVAVLWKRGGDPHAWGSAETRRRLHACVFAAALAGVYIVAVMRVGGDFMYARLLIPTVPFFLILLDYGIAELTAQRLTMQCIAVALVCGALVFMPGPFKDADDIRGIVDEWTWYTPDYSDEFKVAGVVLRHAFEGLPVRVAFFGTEARMVYYAKVPVAVESETGLTDRFVAHQNLSERGRIGHEKGAPASYLIEQRHIDFVFAANAANTLHLRELIPIVPIEIHGLRGLVLHWNPELLEALKKRGAGVPDFPSWLDGQISQLDHLPRETISKEYAMFKRFYFDYVSDQDRQRPFLERVAAARQ